MLWKPKSNIILVCPDTLKLKTKRRSQIQKGFLTFTTSDSPSIIFIISIPFMFFTVVLWLFASPFAWSDPSASRIRNEQPEKDERRLTKFVIEKQDWVALADQHSEITISTVNNSRYCWYYFLIFLPSATLLQTPQTRYFSANKRSHRRFSIIMLHTLLQAILKERRHPHYLLWLNTLTLTTK